MKHAKLLSLLAVIIMVAAISITFILRKDNNIEKELAEAMELGELTFMQEEKVDDISIKVSSYENSLPENSTLSVSKTESRSFDNNSIKSYSYDIKVLDENENEIQPTGQVMVSFGNIPETNNPNLNVNVYHENELIESIVKDGKVYAATSGFSNYTVEFTYKDIQYVMQGGTEVKLKDILDKVGISGEVDDVTISNPELVSAKRVNNEWIITSHEAFTSTEWMKVKIGETTYDIVLTDAVTKYGSIAGGKGYYQFDSATGELLIRGLNGDTTDVTVSCNHSAASAWPWYDIRKNVKKVTFAAGTNGSKVSFSGIAGFMFAEMENLEEVDFSGIGEVKANGLARMFSGCKKLKVVDMSNVTTSGNLSNMQNMFRDCTSLTHVYINNEGFKTRAATSSQDGAQLANMFNGCTSLELVDMSNITLTSKKDGSLDSPFTSSKIKKIMMDNTKFNGVKKLDGFVKSVENLEEVSMAGNVKLDDARTMKEMFANNTSLKTLDISGFGTLPKILNMNDFIKDCNSLVTLNIDNLDNSNIGPTNNRHTVVDTSDTDNYITEEEGRKVGAQEYGREIFGVGITNDGEHFAIPEKFPNLATISANNSTVWMCKNSRGTAGSEYFIAANDSDVLYFTNKDTTLKQGGKEVDIDSKRDYIDLIIDRDGVHNHTLTPTTSTLPDATTNINISNGDLNKLGLDTDRAGKLTPGVYTIGTSEWKEDKIKPMGSYYRISYIGEVDYTISDTENDQIVITEVNGVHYINTINKPKDAWGSGDYTIDCSGNNAIHITYKKAGQDIEGRLYDIVVTINKITFKDVDNVPEYEERGDHNGNRYIDRNVGNAGGVTNPDGTYYRTVLMASRRNGITFRNYVRVGDPAGFSGKEEDHSYRALSGGSGTDIDFTIEFKPAEGNTEQVKDDKTFVFYVDDLDVPATQDWDYPEANDPCYDTLTVDKATYGKGGEGFILGTGNQTDTITFAEHTGLRKVNGNEIITTGSDPSTSWSEFEVKADPKGSEYTWTSGIACDSYALRNTIPPNNGLRIIKEWNDRGADKSPRPDDLSFEIKYTDESDNQEKTVDARNEWDKTSDPNKWIMTIDDVNNKHLPAGGYSATETGPDKYDIVKGNTPLPVSYNEQTGYFEVTFKNKEQTEDITITKNWVDTDAQKDKRPANGIELQIKDESGTVVDKYNLQPSETSHTFTVPKYNKDGDETTYTADEKELNAGDLKFYTKSISGTTVTNTFKVPDEKIDLKVTKKWVDTEEQQDKRPAEIKLKVLNGSTVVEEYTLDTATETEHTFTGLTKYDSNGNEIKYNVDEEEVNAGDLKFYTKSISGTTITNTFTTPGDKVEVTATKAWEDTEKQALRRPSVIKLVVKNGTEVVQEHNLKTIDETSYTFTDLAKYDENGDEITYTVDEQEVEEGDLRFYTKSSVVDNVITNTYKDMPTKVVVKYVDKDTGKDITDEITIDGNVDDEYTSEKKDFEKYDFLESTDNTSGKMDEDTITVTYYYSKKPAKVIVKYIDKATGKEIEVDTEIDGKIDDKYTTEQKNFENYKFLESTDNTEGEMTEDAITVIYYYEKQEEIKPEPKPEPEPEPEPESEPEVEEKTITPKTGTNIMSYVTALGLSLISIITSGKALNKKGKKRREYKGKH